MFSAVRCTHNERPLKAKGKPDSRHPSQSYYGMWFIEWESLTKWVLHFKLWLLFLFLYLCGSLDHMWLTFRKLNAYRMQCHRKNTVFFIRHFLHFLSSFSIDDSLPSSYFIPGTLALEKPTISPSASLAWFSFNLLPKQLQCETWMVAPSKL